MCRVVPSTPISLGPLAELAWHLGPGAWAPSGHKRRLVHGIDWFEDPDVLQIRPADIQPIEG